jgi:uncharacterized membrane protein
VKLDAQSFLAILSMAIATYATRMSGLYLMRSVAVTGRMKAALDALPPAILMAIIAPTILTTGIAETAAAVVTAVAAMLRLPLVAVIVIGVVSVVILRMVVG